MKKILFALMMTALVGCATIKREVYKAEDKVATEYLDGKLEEEALKQIEDGNLTVKQWEAIKPGAEWMLKKIQERARRKKAEEEQE